MKNLIYLLALLTIVSCSQKNTQTKNLTDFQQNLQNAIWIDLSHSFDESTVYWPTNTPFKHDTVSFGMTDKGYFYSSFIYSAEEHGGTHFDAPIHFAAGKNTIEAVPLSNLHGPGIVIDVSEKALKNRDYLVSVEDIKAWEMSFGEIPAGAVVLLRTGYGQFYSERKKYLGTALTGKDAVPQLHFPGLSPEAAQWLAENRHINAVGLDTPSIDYGQSTDFQVHRILCKNDITAYENVANLEQVPLSGSYIIAMPMKIKGGSGSPLRLFALLADY